MKKLSLLAIVLALALTACASPATSAQTAVPTTMQAAPIGGSPNSLPTMGVLVTTFPTGTFRCTGTSRDWIWDLNADGTFFSRGTGAEEKGTYTVTGDQITIKGDYCGDVVGTYTWTSDGTLLRFAAPRDACSQRRGIIMDGLWLRQPQE